MYCLHMPKAKFSRSDSQNLNQHQLLSDVKPNCLLASCRSIMLAAVFAKTSHHTLFHNVPVSLEVRCLKFKQGYVLEIVYNLFLVLLSMSISNFFLNFYHFFYFAFTHFNFSISIYCLLHKHWWCCFIDSSIWPIFIAFPFSLEGMDEIWNKSREKKDLNWF